MTDSTGRINGDGEGGSGESPAVRELRQHLAEPGPWPERFRRLAEAIARVDEVTCEECLALLDVYVDVELAGEPVRRQCPALWQHLQTCADCAAAHDLLFETLLQEREGRLQPLPRRLRLPFLEPTAPDAPWIARFRSRLAGAPFGLTFTLAPTYVRDLLSPAQPLPVLTRRASRRPRLLLLVSDSISLGDRQVAVEVVGSRVDQRPGWLHLQATVASTIALPENLWAVLTWGEETRAAPVDEQGQADLGQMSLAVLQKALEMEDPILEITFEARSESASR